MISCSFNFCSNDHEFIDEAIAQASKYSDDIHVTYLDKFFNGDEENHELIAKHIQTNVGRATFHMLPWPADIRSRSKHDYYFYKYCHNLCRWNNIQQSKHDYIMFMDSDLVPEGDKVVEWFKSIDLEEHLAYYFMIYSYHRSKTIPTRWDESTVIMSNKKHITNEQIWSLSEIQAFLNPPTMRQILGLDGKPMFHHYGWTGGKNDEECKARLLRKTKSWGHTFDRDWVKVIEDEFSHPYQGPWVP